jgi:hydroxyacylglutathione hydrolase
MARGLVIALALVALALGTSHAHGESVEPAALEAQLAAGTAPPILDVRSASEYARDHVPGAVHAPFTSVSAHVEALHLDPRAPVVVYCEHGPRAWMARVALRWAGFTDVRLLSGHMTTWRSQGRPIETSQAPAR